jgi:hypothetical protein
MLIQINLNPKTLECQCDDELTTVNSVDINEDGSFSIELSQTQPEPESLHYNIGEQ